MPAPSSASGLSARLQPDPGFFSALPPWRERAARGMGDLPQP